VTLSSIVANLTGGAGANIFTISGFSGVGTLDGQGGTDTVVATNDVNFGLTATSLTRSGLGTFTLMAVETANLTGGTSANTFTVSGWAGTTNLDGAGANDAYNVTFIGSGAAS